MSTIRPYWVTARTASQRVLAEPAGMVVSLGIYAAVTLVLGSLWRTATAANAGEIAGYSAVALSWYVAASEAVTIPLPSRVIEQTGEEIASGAVAVELLRPASVAGIRIASQVGSAWPRLILCMLAGAGLAGAFGGAPPNAAALVLAAPSLVLAIVCNLVAQHAFAGASFWLRDARSTWFIYQKLVFVVGGMLIPLEVLPAPVTAVAKVLPFMAMAYAPARLAAGFFEPWLLAVQLGWIVVLLGLTLRVFASGERRLQVVGG